MECHTYSINLPHSMLCVSNNKITVLAISLHSLYGYMYCYILVASFQTNQMDSGTFKHSGISHSMAHTIWLQSNIFLTFLNSLFSHVFKMFMVLRLRETDWVQATAIVRCSIQSSSISTFKSTPNLVLVMVCGWSWFFIHT